MTWHQWMFPQTCMQFKHWSTMSMPLIISNVWFIYNPILFNRYIFYVLILSAFVFYSNIFRCLYIRCYPQLIMSFITLYEWLFWKMCDFAISKQRAKQILFRYLISVKFADFYCVLRQTAKYAKLNTSLHGTKIGYIFQLIMYQAI